MFIHTVWEREVGGFFISLFSLCSAYRSPDTVKYL